MGTNITSKAQCLAESIGAAIDTAEGFDEVRYLLEVALLALREDITERSARADKARKLEN
jgi:hypothetical protein